MDKSTFYKALDELYTTLYEYNWPIEDEFEKEIDDLIDNAVEEIIQNCD